MSLWRVVALAFFGILPTSHPKLIPRRLKGGLRDGQDHPRRDVRIVRIHPQFITARKTKAIFGRGIINPHSWGLTRYG